MASDGRMKPKLMASVRYNGRRGLWLLTSMCGDCGSMSYIGRAARVRSAPRLNGTWARWPICTGYYNGRPGGRCGFALSYFWAFHSLSKIDSFRRWLKVGE